MVWAIVGIIVDLPVLAERESIEPEDQRLFNIYPDNWANSHSVSALQER